MYPKFKETLYHGTVSEISKVDVTSGRDKNDAVEREYLYQITLDTEYAKTLNLKVFEQADVEWLDYQY